MKVCHMTSVHISSDVRVLVRECQSLADAGYETYLVAQGDSRKEFGVHVVGVGEMPKSRIKRMRFFTRKVFEKALELECDIYHVHDPELIPYGLKLKKLGKKVIFDSHEDIPAQIQDKEWIPKLFRNLIAYLYEKYQKNTMIYFDAIVAATPHIGRRLEKHAKKIVVVNNFPRLDDVLFQEKPFVSREKQIGYAGGLDELRGKETIISAMREIDGKFLLAGPDAIENEKNIINLGRINRAQVNKLYEDSRMGIVLYLPAANHYDAQPNKMFEYMAAGLPVVTSDFELWKEIVEVNDCGICVNPYDVKQVVDACNKLLSNPELAERMGRNGREAIENKYNWDCEKTKLLDLYSALC